MEKTYQVPNVVWLRVTDYMHGWLEMELSGEARIGERRVICLQSLPGVKEAMKMESCTDTKDGQPQGCSMSAQKHNYMEAGLQLDPDKAAARETMAPDELDMYMPMETPRLCVTQEGLLRPWALNVTYGREQAAAVQRAIRAAFWQAVEAFDREYVRQHPGHHHTAIEMIEAWCVHTGTPDTYAEAMRREWQRRQKRNG